MCSDQPLLLNSCPFVEKFSLEIETYYTPDGGQLENVFNLKVLICCQDDDDDDDVDVDFDDDGGQLHRTCLPCVAMMIGWLNKDDDIFDHHQGSDLSGRVTDLIDVVKDQQQNYVPEVIIIIIIIIDVPHQYGGGGG